MASDDKLSGAEGVPFEPYDVKRAFMRIENELIDSMMRNLRNHLKEESDEGFDWSQWQVEQLKYLQEYRRRNKKVFGPRFSSINDRIEEAIRHAHENGQKEEELNILNAISGNQSIRPRFQNPSQPAVEAAGDAFFRINDKKLEALVEAAHSDLEKAEQAVLRRVDDQYRQIIYNAQMYANTGAGTVEKAVDMATKDFLMKGIDSIQYRNGTRHTISDYADMYIRTAERRAYLMGEGKKRQEWGEQLVIVNRRGKMTAGNFGHACTKCIPWLGRILIDDVYSGGKPDGEHDLLSDAMAQGFLHPRCRDGFTTYFPGISPQEDPVTKKEVKEAVKAEREEQLLQNAERQQERYERLAEYSLDPENKRLYEARAEQWGQKYARTLIDELLDPEDDTPIDWPPRGERMGREKAKILRQYGKQKEIDLIGLADYDLPEASVKEIVDDAAKYLEDYPELKEGRPSISFTAEYMNSSKSFAGTTNHLVTINANAYRDLEKLEDEYKKLVKAHWFPQGTDHHALIAHEIGHVIHHRYPEINPIEIAMEISGEHTFTGLIRFLRDNLSLYAAYYKNGQEIISESYACVLTGVDNDFALQFVQECNKIINKRKGVK